MQLKDRDGISTGYVEHIVGECDLAKEVVERGTYIFPKPCYRKRPMVVKFSLFITEGQVLKQNFFCVDAGGAGVWEGKPGG